MVGTSGAEISITNNGDPMLAGTTLTIPSGALTTDQTITIERGTDQAKPGQTALGPSVRFLPDGLTFATPATLKLPFNKASLMPGQTVIVAVTSTSGRTEMSGSGVVVDTETGIVTIAISHFTDYQVLTGTLSQIDGGADGGGHDGSVDGGVDGGHLDATTDGPPDQG
jgi:hypothetical protein